jgi:hypothetical protein
MEIDCSDFDNIYNIFATDIVNKLTKKFNYKIEIFNKKYHLGDIFILYINGNEFKFNLMKYIDESMLYGEKKAFDNLYKNIDKMEKLYAK